MAGSGSVCLNNFPRTISEAMRIHNSADLSGASVVACDEPTDAWTTRGAQMKLPPTMQRKESLLASEDLHFLDSFYRSFILPLANNDAQDVKLPACRLMRWVEGLQPLEESSLCKF